MKLLKQVLWGLCPLLLTVLFTPGVRADAEWDRPTRATFSSPLEVPGAILPGGTYIFRLYESFGDRNIVQIWNDDQTNVLVIALAIDIERSEEEARYDKPVFTFEERSDGAPHALHAWFYPGDTVGRQFVYPHSQAAVAATNSVPAPNAVPVSPPPAPAEAPEATSPAITQQPEIAEQSAPTQPQTVPDTSAIQPAELPKTASMTPLIALLGMLSLAAAGGLRILAKVLS